MVRGSMLGLWLLGAIVYGGCTLVIALATNLVGSDITDRPDVALLRNMETNQLQTYRQKMNAAVDMYQSRLKDVRTKLAKAKGDPDAGTQVALSDASWVKVDADSLNLRERPGGALITSIPRGTKLIKEAERGGWTKVRDQDGLSGWMFSKYLTDVGDDTMASTAT